MDIEERLGRMVEKEGIATIWTSHEDDVKTIGPEVLGPLLDAYEEREVSEQHIEDLKSEVASFKSLSQTLVRERDEAQTERYYTESRRQGQKQATEDMRQRLRAALQNRDKVREERDEARAIMNGVLHAVQRYQPPGSPLPTDTIGTVEWIVGTLVEARDEAIKDRDKVIEERDELRAVLTRVLEGAPVVTEADAAARAEAQRLLWQGREA